MGRRTGQHDVLALNDLQFVFRRKSVLLINACVPVEALDSACSRAPSLVITRGQQSIEAVSSATFVLLMMVPILGFVRYLGKELASSHQIWKRTMEINQQAMDISRSFVKVKGIISLKHL